MRSYGRVIWTDAAFFDTGSSKKGRLEAQDNWVDSEDTRTAFNRQVCEIDVLLGPGQEPA